MFDARGLHNLTLYVAAISGGIKIDWWIWLYDPGGTKSRIDPTVDQYYLTTYGGTQLTDINYGFMVYPGPLNDSFLGPSMFRLGGMQTSGGVPSTGRVAYFCGASTL